ncbi:MAG TPA: ribose-5-phosphate isomerase RpiA [Chloroflexota bacterium]|jgi:ribose 5-phosphate isomerase A|nr:ribose-5-phosphate isomerase RpiA [Chloroflexota bacterium]
MASAPLEAAKMAAAARAVELVEDGMSLGIGTGSTAAYFITLLGERVRDGLSVIGVPTSSRAEALARAAGIPLTDLRNCPQPDLDVDGADEIDPALNLLKGGGGALLHEKMVALATARFVVIADQTKLVDRLGGYPIAVEIVLFGWTSTMDRIVRLGAAASLRGGDANPFITDSGNLILDVRAPVDADIFAFGREMKSLTGVVEYGLFEGLASQVVVGHLDGTVREMERK